MPENTYGASGLNWPALEADIERQGFALTPPLLSSTDCEHLTALYGNDQSFRKRIVMARHAFGEGDYGYFADPLPPLVQALRERCHLRLRPASSAITIANDLPHEPTAILLPR